MRTRMQERESSIEDFNKFYKEYPEEFKRAERITKDYQKLAKIYHNRRLFRRLDREFYRFVDESIDTNADFTVHFYALDLTLALSTEQFEELCCDLDDLLNDGHEPIYLGLINENESDRLFYLNGIDNDTWKKVETTAIGYFGSWYKYYNGLDRIVFNVIIPKGNMDRVSAGFVKKVLETTGVDLSANIMKGYSHCNKFLAWRDFSLRDFFCGITTYNK